MTKWVATLALALTLPPPTPSLFQVWGVLLPQFTHELSGVDGAWKPMRLAESPLLGQGFLGTPSPGSSLSVSPICGLSPQPVLRKAEGCRLEAAWDSLA